VLIGVIVQVLKPRVDGSFVPFFAICLGIVLAVLLGLTQGKIGNASDLASFIIGGFFAALTAVGGYEATIDKIKSRPE